MAIVTDDAVRVADLDAGAPLRLLVRTGGGSPYVRFSPDGRKPSWWTASGSCAAT